MSHRVKVALFVALSVAWISVMAKWIFLDRSKPDPSMWSIPGTLYLAVWPHPHERRGGDDPE